MDNSDFLIELERILWKAKQKGLCNWGGGLSRNTSEVEKLTICFNGKDIFTIETKFIIKE